MRAVVTVAETREPEHVEALRNVLTDISGGDLVIVDGNRGIVILNPDEETQEHYERTRSSLRSFENRLGELRDLPAETLDGSRILLLGNIEFPHEATHCIERGADGVGLYRTEFLYLGKHADPTEGEHVDAYMTVLRLLGSRPLTIRTLDLGADKLLPGTVSGGG